MPGARGVNMSGTARARSARPPSAMANRSVSSRAAPSSRAASVAPTTSTRPGALSPSSSIVSGTISRSRSPNNQVVGVKRKERDYEEEAALSTNINVVVRCRGRNDREVRENSGVVVQTDKTVGKSIELSMGPNALSNKTYHFDRVFSPAASQAMVFDEVVAPILDEMLHGFNCTIFAYGQTGTGKTYTMSGDMSDRLGLMSDSAGIIPRVLNALFKNLDVEEPKESSVKCSFIELYNEELRDLIALDENAKLKIYDQEKKGHTTTVVQGMEEAHIKNADGGIALLQTGNQRRQVAATKCNDLSSRSHTVFTVTVYAKRVSESGEDMVCTGKLNLVDLAGSENIQRSGAEDKRATEAGAINKSLLTLGRVINALVDKGSHIPYRESKLTRLLQDSLGGRTKTCIIATISPAKSNLEETMSTLDYAFRAKNIKNKPQINQLMSKHTLLREFTAEIQYLKSELINTRQRNGVYLTNEAYEDMTIESESRRILSEEQKAKLEIMEASLRNKIQDLFELTTEFSNLRKDNDQTKKALSETSDVLKQANIVLADTEQNLANETLLRKAHERTEKELASKGEELISTLGRTVKDVNSLHNKLRRKSNLQSINRANWQSSQSEVATVTKLIEAQVGDFQISQQQQVSQLVERIQSFVNQQLQGFEEQNEALGAASSDLEKFESDMRDEHSLSCSEMTSAIDEIETLRKEIKTKVSESLQGLSDAAGKISSGITIQLQTFSKDCATRQNLFRSFIEDSFKSASSQINAQREEADKLRVQLAAVAAGAVKKEEQLTQSFEETLEAEKQAAATDRTEMLKQITSLINENGRIADARRRSNLDKLTNEMKESRAILNADLVACQDELSTWLVAETEAYDNIVSGQETLLQKSSVDQQALGESCAQIIQTAESVHHETIEIFNSHLKVVDDRVDVLDGVRTRAFDLNARHQSLRVQGLERLSSAVSSTLAKGTSALDERVTETFAFHDDTRSRTFDIINALPTLDTLVCDPISQLRETIEGAPLTEYMVTGETPAKRQYIYPKALPRTASREEVLLRGEPTIIEMPALEAISVSAPASPSKAQVYPDNPNETVSTNRATMSPTSPRKKQRSEDTMALSLRELDANVARAPLILSGRTISDSKVDGRKKHKFEYDSHTAPVTVDLSKGSTIMGPPPFKKLAVDGLKGRGGRKAEGRENMPLPQNVAIGRRLRSSVRQS